MAFIMPLHYFHYPNDPDVKHQLNDAARKEFNSGRQVEFNGKKYITYGLLMAEIATYQIYLDSKSK
jgi:hypothetical protein